MSFQDAGTLADVKISLLRISTPSSLFLSPATDGTASVVESSRVTKGERHDHFNAADAPLCSCVQHRGARGVRVPGILAIDVERSGHHAGPHHKVSKASV